jgi:phage tail tube protein FII
LASQASVKQLQADLSAEIQAAKDIGLQGDVALQAGLDSLSEKMGVDQAALIEQLGTTADQLKNKFAADIAGVATSIADTKTALEAAIAEAKAAGLEGDVALKTAIESVAADQQTSAADLLTKLGTTEAGLKTEFAAGLAGVSAEIAEVQRNLSAEIQAAKDIGLTGDAALQAGIDSLSQKMGVDQAALLEQLGTTAADLKTQFAADIAASQTATAAEIASTKTALEGAIAEAKAAGLEGDAAHDHDGLREALAAEGREEGRDDTVRERREEPTHNRAEVERRRENDDVLGVEHFV